MANFFEKLLCPSVENIQWSLTRIKDQLGAAKEHMSSSLFEHQKALDEHDEDLKELRDLFSALVSEVRKGNSETQEQLTEHKNKLKELEGKLSESDFLFSSSKARTYKPEEEDPEVTGVTLDKSCVEFFTQLVERQYKDDKLIKAQRRFTNRLLRLLRYTADSFTVEDLKRAEKWNKVLRKRFAEHNKELK